MRMKSIAIGVALIALVLRFYVGDYDQADGKLEAFYGQILSVDFAGARKSIDGAIMLWPSNGRYYDWRAYLMSQNLPPHCSHLLDGSPAPPKAEDQAAIGSAIADYRKALELNSRDAVAHHNLGWLEHLAGDDAAAKRDLVQAAAIDPGNPMFHLSHGMFLKEAGEDAKASEEYQIAIELSPSVVDSQFFARYRIRDEKEAVSMVEAVISRLERKLARGNDPIIEARLGKLYLFQGDLSRASQLLEDAARQLPNLPMVWMNLGDVQDRQGSAADAMDSYRKASVVYDVLAGTYLRMAELELRNGHRSAAAEHFSQAIQRWQYVAPVTAAHNNRLYAGPRQRIDDLLPTTLIWYTTPCEASRAWRGLAQLFPEKREYSLRTQTCEQLPSPHRFGDVDGGSKP